ncbi:MAG: AEC family transporter, partial [Spirochaetia bacterium]|nr:AEC family transporter [Spirochaetia bacterium]
MELLGFVLKSVYPFFILIGLGFALRRFGFVNEAWAEISNRLVFYVALPALLFVEISRSNLRSLYDGRLVALVLAVFFLFAAAVWIFTRLSIANPASRGVFVQGAFRSNVAIIGLPLVDALLGREALALSAMILAFLLPLFVLVSIFLLSYSSNPAASTRSFISKNLVSLLLNPLIHAVALGTVVALIPQKPPALLFKPVEYLSTMTFPMSLLVLGMGMNPGRDRRHKGMLAGVIFLKNLVLPAILCALAWFLGYRGNTLLILFVVAASPTAVASYVMARAMKQDAELAAGIVFHTTLWSALTVPLGIWILK